MFIQAKNDHRIQAQKIGKHNTRIAFFLPVLHPVISILFLSCAHVIIADEITCKYLVELRLFHWPSWHCSVYWHSRGVLMWCMAWIKIIERKIETWNKKNCRRGQCQQISQERNRKLTTVEVENSHKLEQLFWIYSHTDTIQMMNTASKPTIIRSLVYFVAPQFTK